MIGFDGDKQRPEAFGGIVSAENSGVAGAATPMPAVLRAVVPVSPFLTHSIQPAPATPLSSSMPLNLATVLVGGQDAAFVSLPSPMETIPTIPAATMGGVSPTSPGLQRNVVFEWQSGSSPGTSQARRRTENGVQGTHGPSSPTTASQRGSSPNEQRQSSKPVNSHVQTTVQTSTVTPTAGGSYDLSPRVFSPQNQERTQLFDQLTQQLESVHQEYRDGYLEAKEYHKKVADLMVQLHTFHGSSPTGNLLSNLHAPASPNGGVVVLPPGVQVVHSVSPSAGQQTRLVSAPAGLVVASPAGYTSPQTPSIQGLPMNVMARPVPEPHTTTTTTTTTLKRGRKPSVDPPVESGRRTEKTTTKSTTTRLMAHGLTCADLLLTLKLVQSEDQTTAASQVVALLYTLLSDVANALEFQLKLPEDSVYLAPALRSVLTSTKAACAMASELGSYANSLYKALKRCGIHGLKPKHNRLRILANEAQTRRWKGREIIAFIASLLHAIEMDLKPKEKLIVIEVLLSKLGKRVGDALSELYNIFNVIFPNCFDDALSRISALRDVRGQASMDVHARGHSFIAFNEPCQVCCDPCIGFRYRCLDCFPDKASGSGEHLLCGACFVARFDDNHQRPSTTGIFNHEIHRHRAGREIDNSQFYHSKPDTYHHAFVCEVPASVFLSEHRRFHPLRHVTIAPNQGWWSAGAVVPMVEGRKGKTTSYSPSRKTPQEQRDRPEVEDESQRRPIAAGLTNIVGNVQLTKQESFGYEDRFEGAHPVEADPQSGVNQLQTHAGVKPSAKAKLMAETKPDSMKSSVSKQLPSRSSAKEEAAGNSKPGHELTAVPSNKDIDQQRKGYEDSNQPLKTVDDADSLPAATFGSASNGMMGSMGAEQPDQLDVAYDDDYHGDSQSDDESNQGASYDPVLDDVMKENNNGIEERDASQLGPKCERGTDKSARTDRHALRTSISHDMRATFSETSSRASMTDDHGSDDEVFLSRQSGAVKPTSDSHRRPIATGHSLAEESVETRNPGDYRREIYSQDQTKSTYINRKDKVSVSRANGHHTSTAAPKEIKDTGKSAHGHRSAKDKHAGSPFDSPPPTFSSSTRNRLSEDKGEGTPRRGFKSQGHSLGSSHGNGKASAGVAVHSLKNRQAPSRTAAGGMKGSPSSGYLDDRRGSGHTSSGAGGFAGPLPGRRSRALGEKKNPAAGMRF